LSGSEVIRRLRQPVVTLGVHEELRAQVASEWSMHRTLLVRDEAALGTNDSALLDTLHAYAAGHG
jgi:hypothetical protein